MKKLPPPPPGWNKSVADLMAEVDSGAKQAVGSPELDWARDYERSLLPPDTRYPCEGEIYEALEDFPVSYVTSWAVAFTFWGTCRRTRPPPFQWNKPECFCAILSNRPAINFKGRRRAANTRSVTIPRAGSN